jgi:hypothetical protein
MRLNIALRKFKLLGNGEERGLSLNYSHIILETRKIGIPKNVDKASCIYFFSFWAIKKRTGKEV